MDIISSRIASHRLQGEPFGSAEAVVAHYGAVQAQDFSAAEWSVSLRMRDVSKADIDAAFNDGKILRTHVLRPTWHFVLPEDIGWMTTLTAPRIKQAMAYYNRRLELDDKFFGKTHRIITEALAREHFLTRSELAASLARNGIAANGQRLGHIVMQAEIDGLICSGPLYGKQFTYSLIAERSSYAKNLSRDESLALLARRYFTSHGPATLQDFAWWSGLSAEDAKKAAASIRDEFHCETVASKEFLFKEGPKAKAYIPPVLLLSVYDEYVIAYKDYGPIFIDKTKSLSNIFGNARLDYVIVKDGRIVGTWRRKIGPKKIVIETKLEIKLDSKYKRLLKIEAERYSKFYKLPVEVM